MITDGSAQLPAAFDELMAKMQGAARAVDAVGTEDSGGAEGYRHLLRLLSAGLDLFVERADPERPLLTTWMSPTRKFLGDNPDTIYSTAPVRGGGTYTLHIEPANAIYLGLVIYGRTGDGWRVVASISDDDLEPSDDGSYDVTLSATEQGAGNWVPLSHDAVWVMVREYFADRDTMRGAALSIERAVGAPPAGLDAATLARRFEDLAHWIAQQGEADICLADLQLSSPNRAPDLTGVSFPPEVVASFLPTPDVTYQGCGFELRPGERLLVRGRAPDARYWSVQVMNRWLESLDGRSGWNSYELGTTAGEPFEVVLADETVPGQASIALRGRRRGLVAFRALLPNGAVAPVTFEVVGAAPTVGWGRH